MQLLNVKAQSVKMQGNAVDTLDMNSSGSSASKGMIVKVVTSILNGNIEKIVCIFLKKLSNCSLMMWEKINSCWLKDLQKQNRG